MPSKPIFSKFWRRQPDADAPNQLMEAPVTKSEPQAVLDTKNLLSYQDIYHAAGILSPRSGYDINKVVEMLNSERIRELPKDIKRASVLMAIEAAGTSANDLLQDATHREQALSAYEAGQQKQLEEFEARKAQDNAKIQAELDRVAAHYAERIRQNNEQVAREKEILRNWQMLKQHESQRISEVIELCSGQPAPASAASTPATGSAAPAIGTPQQAAKATAGK